MFPLVFISQSPFLFNPPSFCLIFPWHYILFPLPWEILSSQLLPYMVPTLCLITQQQLLGLLGRPRLSHGEVNTEHAQVTSYVFMLGHVQTPFVWSCLPHVSTPFILLLLLDTQWESRCFALTMLSSPQEGSALWSVPVLGWLARQALTHL